MLSTHWHTPHHPTEEDFRFFDVLARPAADLIERTLVEEARRESEERFRLAMNVASGVYTVDLNGLVTYVNPAAETMFGWTGAADRQEDARRDELQASGWHAVPASDCPGLQVQRTGVELRELEDTFIRKDGSFFPVVFTYADPSHD